MNSFINSEDSEVSSLRKGAHIDFAEKSQTSLFENDSRFNYEPLFFKHPKKSDNYPASFLGFNFDFPFWISSMTGGTQSARPINQRLASLCKEYNLGMGLGSCRSLLYGNERIEDFQVRKFLGDRPLFANLGLAQLEELVFSNKLDLIHEMMKRIEANGIFIHINPLQEWFQPEGDRFNHSPLEILERFLESFSLPVMVKEVGQGFGPKSLQALLKLPVAGIEFSAFGGTNFSYLEKLRMNHQSQKQDLICVGHGIDEMIEILNALPLERKEFIISGGVRSPVDAFYYLKRFKKSALVGMANSFLAPALKSEQALFEYFEQFKETFLTASQILELKGDQ